MSGTWLLEHWRGTLRSAAAAIAFSLWGTALGAGGDMSAVVPLLIAAWLLSSINLATFPEFSSAMRASGVAFLAAFFLGTGWYIQHTHPNADLTGIAAIWSALASSWAYTIGFFQHWWVQLTIVLALGIAIGVIGPREFQKRARVWHAKQDIEINFANPFLVNEREEAKEKIRKLNMAFLDLTVEEQNLPRGGPGPSPIMSEESPERISIRMRRIALHDGLKQAQAELSSAFQGVLDDLQDKLQKGKLVSKGFSYDAGINSEEIDIPASYWRFLEFSPDYINASGRGLSYTAIAVARSSTWS